MRDPKERLLDMLDAIERIEKYVSKGRAAFEFKYLFLVRTGTRPGYNSAYSSR
jgi:hypothetical protein